MSDRAARLGHGRALGTRFGDRQSNANCFGQSAAQLGQAGAMGEHASSFPTPRLGIGNVAYLLTGTHQLGGRAGLLGGVCS